MATRTVEIMDLVVALEERRDELGITNAEVARRLDVSGSTLSAWLTGGMAPKLNADTQQAFAAFLNVSPRRVVELYGLDLSSRASRGSRRSLTEAA